MGVEHQSSGRWFAQKEVVEVAIWIVVKLLVGLLEVEVEGGLGGHTVLQVLLGVRLGVVGRCKIGCCENWLILDWLVD